MAELRTVRSGSPRVGGKGLFRALCAHCGRYGQRLVSRTTRLDLRLDEVPQPCPDIGIDGEAFLIHGEPISGREPIFVLDPQVKLPARLDLDRDAERALYSVPGLSVANWAKTITG